MSAFGAVTEYSLSEREELILAYLNQVRLIARRIHERVPPSVTLDDLVSAGIIGLISAVDNYDPRHQAKLATYAELKIRGAILDSLRRMDWVPRLKRKQSKVLEAAISEAEQRLGRSASEEDIAAVMGMSVEEYRAALLETQGLNMGSFESPNKTGVSVLQYVADSDEKLPSHIAERAEMERLLIEAIQKMPELERTVLNLHYQEQMTPQEIGRIINLKANRVSQLKSQGIIRLRTYFSKKLAASASAE